MLETAALIPEPERIALRGDLLDFLAEPPLGEPETAALRFRPDHWLLIESGRIVGAQVEHPGDGWKAVDHAGCLILPGFIDTHVHSPQVDVIGSWGAQLLDWLQTYTFPAEARLADPASAVASAELFLDALLANGTTAAVVFPTVHLVAADALFAAAERRGMRLIAGKVMMDRHSPLDLSDTVESAERDNLELISRWHGKGRLAYALTPRFAVTSSPQQLAMAGRLLAADPSLYMQTHVAENRDEMRWVAELFPDSRSYLDVYEQHGLLGPRSVLAHGIWLDDSDRALLSERGAQIAHSPSSNLFLGSGLLDWPQLRDAGVALSLASDVGGGTSLSMIRTMAEAYKVQALRGNRVTAWALLHACTRGAAQALQLGDEIGSLDVGKLADVVVWDWAVGAVAQRRIALARSLHEKFFAWITLADDRNRVETWVAGRRIDIETIARRTTC
jgi:guanine deaminase